jgi:hypothetical protein
MKDIKMRKFAVKIPFEIDEICPQCKSKRIPDHWMFWGDDKPCSQFLDNLDTLTATPTIEELEKIQSKTLGIVLVFKCLCHENVALTARQCNKTGGF